MIPRKEEQQTKLSVPIFCDRTRSRKQRRKRLKSAAEEQENNLSSANTEPQASLLSNMKQLSASHCQTATSRIQMLASSSSSRPKMLSLLLLLPTILALASVVICDGSQEAAAAAAKQKTSNNVILIKYANVTTRTTTGDNSGNDDPTSSNNQEQSNQNINQDQQLNVFKLYEPLSVPVIESKFAHSIQLFDVSQNQLSTLSKDLFCPLSNEVRQLNISHNLLENFDCLGLISQAGQLCLSELRVLDMSHNLIKHLPATGVATLHNLEVLNLSNNLIESLDELALQSLFKLTKLDLSANRIQQLPDGIFHKSTSMQVLRLQSNQLQTSITQIFLSGLISLEELNLSYNNISHVSDSPFLNKVNLTRVDLSHNRLSGLRQDALRVTSVKQATGYRHRLHHNGQYAGVAPKQTHSQSVGAEFFLASNPFICDCHLDWLRKFQPASPGAIKRTVLSPRQSSSLSSSPHNRVHLSSDSMMLADQAAADQLSAQQLMQLSSSSSNFYQNDQPPVILASSASSSDSSNNISEIISNQQQAVDPAAANGQQQAGSRPMATLLANGASQASNLQQQHVTHHYAQIGDLDLIKCTPLFRRNTMRNQQQQQQHHHHDRHQQQQHRGGQTRQLAPPDGAHHNHQNQLMSKQQTDTMIDILGADSSNFLCRYKSHCFALCHCCEFDACDCEMICPNGCSCYYNLSWQTNIIDCSSSNHTVVPDKIPMDVSGLYLDGNNIDSLKPSNLIARRSLKTLYLNSSNLQYIANRTFNGLIELQTLYLHDNLLRSLNGYEFEPLAKLRELYLQSNRLDHISNHTFIYLRSLEILDLSNNRLTSTNLDLFWSIGHHNIRLRQLSIAHNWWSCQCSSINRFRQILKQKFLLNGSVNIVDKNQLRCYYNSSTVGPQILGADNALAYAGQQQQPLYGSYPSNGNSNSNNNNNNRQQTLLTEINQCSEVIEDRQEVDVNPPLIHAPSSLNQQATDQYPSDPFYTPDSLPLDQSTASSSNNNNNPYNNNNPMLPPQPPLIDPMYPAPNLIIQTPDTMINQPTGSSSGTSGQRFGQPSGGAGTMPLTSFILLSILLVGVMVIAVCIVMFVRQQQRFHQSHHKKSSAASTTSVSSSASSTAISSLNGKSHRHHVQQQNTMQNPHHHHQHHHLIMSNGSGGATTTSISQHLAHQITHNNHHHHHSASSQSNIYAALVSPSTGNSTQVPNSSHPINNLNNLYSNSSTTASHHSSSSQHNNQIGGGGYPQQWPSSAQSQQQQQHSVYNHGVYGNGMLGAANVESHYAINASSQASYKTGSLYNAPVANCHDLTAQQQQSIAEQQQQNADWIKLPKVKQFMSKLVNKSLALSGYRACSRDELSAITSDKIYDAFISYDKRDEAFVMQHLSAELEYGQPQYRIADRFRDLPQPTSAYIAEAITSVIGCSHRTIVVLTESYLVSDWCRYELQAALREASIDKTHKIIAVVLDPKCLLDMDNEMRALLTNSAVTIQQQQANKQQQPQQQLVQLDGGSNSNSSDQFLLQQQLVATLNVANQQVSTQPAAQLATGRITFINYNERKFWLKIKQQMPLPRPSTQTLTLTTKN